jgi:hypothetical protein
MIGAADSLLGSELQTKVPLETETTGVNCDRKNRSHKQLAVWKSSGFCEAHGVLPASVKTECLKAQPSQGQGI